MFTAISNLSPNVKYGLLLGLIVVSIMVFCYLFNYKYFKTKKVAIGKYKFNVNSDFVDKKVAADILKNINSKNIILFRHLQKKYLGRGNIPPLVDFPFGKVVSDRIISRYNPEVIVEVDPSAPGTSYTVNKGDKMVLCLRSVDVKALHTADILYFVVLHEISHMGATDPKTLQEVWHHVPEYWMTFKFILEEAKNAGVYDPVDYSKRPIKYCGMDVGYNPYFDPELKYK